MLDKVGKGALYFGARNDGEIIGQQIGDRTLREVSQGIANAIKPQIIPTIIMELCDDKNVIKVTVEGDEKLYSAYGKYYWRNVIKKLNHYEAYSCFKRNGYCRKKRF